MKTKKRIVLMIFLIAVLLIPAKSFAAVGSFSISSSSKSIVTGQTSTLTITATNCAGKFTMSSSDTSVVTVSTSSEWIESGSTSITLTTKKAGTATITITADNVGDTDTNDVVGSKTCSVTVSDAIVPVVEAKSNDSSLKALAVAEGAITPVFSKTVKSYTLNIPNEILEVNVSATANNSRATYSVSGNKELKEGENLVTVTVKAEDGTTSKYKINVIRAKAELALQSAIIKFTSLTGEIVEIPLIPVFAFNTYEYTLADLEYYVSKLDITALANRVEGIVEITGNENLVEGENTITITAKIPATETTAEELKTYTIKVKKLPEPIVIPPTLMQKIGNWFNGVISPIKSWINTNKQQIILGSLITCILALVGLSVYIIIDHKKYKKLLEQLNPKEEEKLEEILTEETEVKENIEEPNEEINEGKKKKEKKIKKEKPEKIKKEKRDKLGKHS